MVGSTIPESHYRVFGEGKKEKGVDILHYDNYII